MNDCQKRGHRKLFITCEDCHQVINQATLKVPNEWISIHDQIPKEDQLVLIYMRGCISLRIFDNNAFHDMESDYYTPLLMQDGVTHWMEIQDPPK